jgi:hypothetical protein
MSTILYAFLCHSLSLTVTATQSTRKNGRENCRRHGKKGQAPVTYTCNPSYLGGRDQEDCSSKLAQANSSQDPISKIPNTKRAGGVAQGVGPEFKHQCHKKKKKMVKRDFLQ